uniref:Uncharacterized protein n=1 Tax=Arundo donax TaxID=35708 RepID=A0A0A9AMI6_ARUDO
MMHWQDKQRDIFGFGKGGRQELIEEAAAFPAKAQPLSFLDAMRGDVAFGSAAGRPRRAVLVADQVGHGSDAEQLALLAEGHLEERAARVRRGWLDRREPVRRGR